jgi:glycosyltransferase involved in cell wall biosynthesis
MHLAVDAVGIKHSGGAVVLEQFLEAATRQFDRITVFTSPRHAREFDVAASERITDQPQDLCDRAYWARMLWCARWFGAECRKVGADVAFSMTGVSCAGGTVPYVTFIQQSLPFCPEALRRLGRTGRLQYAVVMRNLMRRSCSRAAAIFVQTPTMKSWVSSAFAISPNRIGVFPPSARRLQANAVLPEQLRPMLSVPANARLLYVGNDEPYKNLDVVLTALARLRNLVNGATLFVTAPPAHSWMRREGVIPLGRLSGDLLAKAYEIATVLVQPSLVESVSLPLCEAIAAGLPVIAANRPYAHDACGDAAHYFDPLSPSDVLAKTAALLGDERSRLTLAERGRALAVHRASQRPYDAMASALLQVGEGQLARPTIELAGMSQG